MSLRNLVENKDKLDYKALTTSLINEFGITDTITWDAVIPANVQQNLFGGETLRLFSDHPNFATQKDIRTILLKKGQTSQLLILFAKLKDEKLSKQNIEKVTKKFIGGSAAERYVVWFIGNPSNTEFKVVLSGKEGKKIVLKTLPFGINQPYYKTYDFILEEVHKKVSHFFVEPNELWKALWKSFDISVVNKKFYLDIKSAFDSLINDEIFKGSIRIEEARKQFAVRLIGRLIFSWFLKKKGIISENVLSSSAVNKYENYYLEFLEKLFFEVFNTPQKERGKLPDEIKDYPFLNGGLFESQIGDYGDYQGKVFIQNDWFENLFKNTLEKYNFTIDENTSSSSEIAIDPEMLGRIFENLLAEQNPETQESARKSTGSYYTPREIVDYMVEQSISEYLKTNVTLSLSKGDDSALNPASLSQAIEDFVHTEEFPDTLKPYSTQILEKLNTVKVLDPACGSGAFPIGMLQKLIALKLQLSPLERGQRGVSVYDLKLQTILNSIYGCDIQPMAVELSRLRCWLSLIIDEDVDKKKDNWGIANLPNLDFKFVCVNTLIGLPKMVEDSLGTSADDFEKLKQLREEFFTASAKRKLQIEKEFKTLQGSIAEKQREWSTKNTEAVTMLINWNPFKVEKTDWFDPFWMFGIKEGFDSVIGNPPYIQLQKAFNNKIKYADLYKNQNYKTFDRTGDIYCLFYEKGIQLLKENGLLTYITSNKWMRAGYGEKLREFFTKHNPLQLVDLGPGVFENATVDTNILIIQKCPSSIPAGVSSRSKDASATLAVTLQKEDKEDIAKALNEKGVLLTKLTKDAWFIGSDAEQKLKVKIEKIGKPLKDWDVKIYRGVLTGLNEAFIIDTEKRNEILANCSVAESSRLKSNVVEASRFAGKTERERTEEIIKPILHGRDIKRYHYEWAGLWVIVIPAGWTNENRRGEKPAIFIEKYFPSLMQHLKQFEAKAKKRDDQGDYWWELRHCAYYPEFEKEKVVYSEIVRQPQFYLDSEGYFVEATSFLMTGRNVKYICGLLNSKPVTYFFKKWYAGGGLGEEGYRYKKAFLENLPIPAITPTNEPIVKQIELLVDKILAANASTSSAQNAKTDTSQWEKEIDELVYRMYDLTPEEIKIIEGGKKNDKKIEN